MRFPLFNKRPAPPAFPELFRRFRRILAVNNEVLEKIAEMELALGGELLFDRAYLQRVVTELTEGVRESIYNLNVLAADRYHPLYDRFTAIADQLRDLVSGGPGPLGGQLVLPYSQVNRDLDHLVGAKNANLGEIGANLGLRTPAGFTLTVTAYIRFMEANDLFHQIETIMAGDLTINEQSDRIAILFRQATMPAELTAAVNRQLTPLCQAAGPGVRLAVRSSAVGEDGERSFAGQFLSLLDLEPAAVLDGCRQVMASRFSSPLLHYLGPQTPVREIPMAVGVQVMVAAARSGVIYTRDPNRAQHEVLTIAALAGQGEALVGGKADADRYTLSRHHPFPLIESKITPKLPDFQRHPQLGLAPGSNVLSLPACQRLAETAMLLEKTFEGPQDIEWALTAAGELVILQCRPLQLPAPAPPLPAALESELRQAPILLSGCGHIAQLGVAAGPLLWVTPESDPDLFPVGAIAACRHASPQLSGIVRRAAAIVTEIGSPTGHLATIAREYRTPALLGVGDSLQQLATGMEITIDVEVKRIYAGILPGLLALQASQEEPLFDEPEMRTLRRMLRIVAPITLTDPSAPEFQPDNCRTFHDLLRFCHEKAVDSLIACHSETSPDSSRDCPILVAPIPLKIRLIDLGDGLNLAPGSQEVGGSDIRSRPFLAILAGLLNQGAWDREPVPFGIKELMASVTRPLASLAGVPNYSGENLAIVAENYCNVSFRLGYHFNVVDAYLSDDPDDNYIYFRFVGGMADEEKRQRRAELIAQILTALQFKVDRKGDLLIGKVKMLAAEHMAAVLNRLGELVAFTRQLDARMADDETVDRYFHLFLSQTRDGWRASAEGNR